MSVEVDTVEAVDGLVGKPFGGRHPAMGQRSKFVRLATKEKLKHELIQFQSQ